MTKALASTSTFHEKALGSSYYSHRRREARACICVCLSVHVDNSNTINPIDLKFLQKEWSASGSVLLEFGLESDTDFLNF
jgi:hypothetical protein